MGWSMRPGDLARGSKTLQVRSRGCFPVDSSGWRTNPSFVGRTMVVVGNDVWVCVRGRVELRSGFLPFRGEWRGRERLGGAVRSELWSGKSVLERVWFVERRL